MLLGPDFGPVRWVGGALSCAVATSLMALTGTVHPPAGATALMAVADDQVASLGWFLIPVVLLGCGVMLVMALLVNNIQRRFPFYWWTPEATGEYWRREVITSGDRSDGGEDNDMPNENKSSVRTPSSSGDLEMGKSAGEDESSVVISRGLVQVPRGLHLSPEEKKLLETISLRL